MLTVLRASLLSFDEMHWRMIGPFRGGRTVAAVGIPSQPNVFYIGVNNGGVWKTTDAGRIWVPIFDDQPTGSRSPTIAPLSGTGWKSVEFGRGQDIAHRVTPDCEHRAEAPRFHEYQ